MLRKGKLWADGTSPLEPLGQALFRLGSDSFSPDVAEFAGFRVFGVGVLLRTPGTVCYGPKWSIAVRLNSRGARANALMGT